MLGQRTLVAGSAGLFLVVAAGCATVMNGRTADVTLRSVPSEADVTVRDHNGSVVAQTTTPGKVTLKRGRSWLRPAKYSATFEKPGYQTTEAPLDAKLNPWLLGNVVLGGPVGLGVDAASGALWTPKSTEVEHALVMNQHPGSPVDEYGPAEGQPAPRIQMASAHQPTAETR